MNVKAVLGNMKNKGIKNTWNSYLVRKDKREKMAGASDLIQTQTLHLDKASAAAVIEELVIGTGWNDYRKLEKYVPYLLDLIEKNPEMENIFVRQKKAPYTKAAALIRNYVIKRYLPEICRGGSSESKNTGTVLWIQSGKHLDQSGRDLEHYLEKYTDKKLQVFHWTETENMNLCQMVQLRKIARAAAEAQTVIMTSPFKEFGYVVPKKESKWILADPYTPGMQKKGLTRDQRKMKTRKDCLLVNPGYTPFTHILAAGNREAECYENILKWEGTTAEVIKTGLLGTDLFFKKDSMQKAREKLHKIIEFSEEKKILLYVPKKTGIGDCAPDSYELQEKLGDEMILLIWDPKSVLSTKSLPTIFKNKFIFDLSSQTKMSEMELLAAADCLITDYNPAALTYSLLQRPVIFFLSRRETYTRQPETWMNWESIIPGPVVETTEELIWAVREEISAFDPEKTKKYAQEYLEHCDGEVLQRVLYHVIGLPRECWKKSWTYPVIYNSTLRNKNFELTYNLEKGTIQTLKSGALEYRVKNQEMLNDGYQHFLKNGYISGNDSFLGWHIRVRKETQWYYLLENHSLIEKEVYQQELHGLRALIEEEGRIPQIPLHPIDMMVAEAVWKRQSVSERIKNGSAKVGIISINMYSKGLNFACPLHTFAFQQYLKRKGIDSTVIDYQPNYYDNFDLKHPYDYYKKKVKLLERQSPVTEEGKKIREEKLQMYTEKRDLYQAIYHEREIRYEKFQKFIEENYIKTDITYNSDLLEVSDPDFDYYICATDVIWKDAPNTGYDRGFLLGSSCMENKGKIAYAASRGVPGVSTPEQKQLFFHYLSDYDAISVREKSLQKYIAENSDWNPPVVIDPVLLHDRKFYEDLAVKPEEENYLFLYYVMEKAEATIEQAVKYARKHNLTIVEMTELPLKDGRVGKFTDVRCKYRYDVGIEEWLGYFLHAKCIFTNSFHACCISILFEKEFYVGHRNGDKVKNILQTFGLSDRLFTRNMDLAEIEQKTIHYDQVEEILEKKRKEADEFLQDAFFQAADNRIIEKDYETEKKQAEYPICYNSGRSQVTSRYEEGQGKLRKLSSGNLEYYLKENIKNNGSAKLQDNRFEAQGVSFIGWRLRIKIDTMWFYCLTNGKLTAKNEFKKQENRKEAVFAEESAIPYLPVNRISLMVAEAVWEKDTKDTEIAGEKG